MFCNGEGILMEKFSKNGILDSIWYASLTPPSDIALEGKQGEYYYKTVLPLKEKLRVTKIIRTRLGARIYGSFRLVVLER